MSVKLGWCCCQLPFPHSVVQVHPVRRWLRCCKRRQVPRLCNVDAATAQALLQTALPSRPNLSPLQGLGLASPPMRFRLGHCVVSHLVYQRKEGRRAVHSSVAGGQEVPGHQPLRQP